MLSIKLSLLHLSNIDSVVFGKEGHSVFFFGKGELTLLQQIHFQRKSNSLVIKNDCSTEVQPTDK